MLLPPFWSRGSRTCFTLWIVRLLVPLLLPPFSSRGSPTCFTLACTTPHASLLPFTWLSLQLYPGVYVLVPHATASLPLLPQFPSCRPVPPGDGFAVLVTLCTALAGGGVSGERPLHKLRGRAALRPVIPGLCHRASRVPKRRHFPRLPAARGDCRLAPQVPQRQPCLRAQILPGPGRM